jgi:hypothetical protein
VGSQVRFVEEPCLKCTHGARFAEYTSRVGRLVPGLGGAEGVTDAALVRIEKLHRRGVRLEVFTVA